METLLNMIGENLFEKVLFNISHKGGEGTNAWL